MKIRPYTAIDFYKLSHIIQHHLKTTFVLANMTPRGDKNALVLPDFDHKIVNFGGLGVAKWLLRDLWNKEFFNRPKEEVVEYFKRRMVTSLAKNENAVNRAVGCIAALHDLGYLPVAFCELPEGKRVNLRVPTWIMYNTHPDFAWVTTYLETQLSAELWKPLTSATTAREFRRQLDKYTALTGAAPEFVQWQGHGFEARGMSGIYDAAQSGAGHLLSFTGTDTVNSIDYLEDYYNADAEKELVGGSVPATEHSVTSESILSMTEEEFIEGEKEFDLRGLADPTIEKRDFTDNEKHLIVGEYLFIKHLITEVYPDGVVSIVSDTFDFWATLTQIAPRLKAEIMAREGRVVFRPDSGDPVKIVIGDDDAKERHIFEGAVQTLDRIFGSTVTAKGFRTIDTHVGLIYGDSISLARETAILDGLMRKGYSSGNIVFGIGSFTYQFVTRDTFGTAIKATFVIVDGRGIELYKQPKTDSGVKNSARGLLKTVEDENGDFILHDRNNASVDLIDGQYYLTDVGDYIEIFRNSNITHEFTLAGIRETLAASK